MQTVSQNLFDMSYHAVPLDLSVPQIRKMMKGQVINVTRLSMSGSGFGPEASEPSKGVVVQLLPHQIKSLSKPNRKSIRLAFTPEQIRYHGMHGGGIFGDIWNKT